MSLIIQPTNLNIELTARALKDGALIGLPTETVYGLAADAENESAVKRIFDVKNRPVDHPVIVHIGSLEFLNKWAVEIPEYAFNLAHHFWPGPLTLILKRSKLAKNIITGGQDSVGVRIPSHPVAMSVIKFFHIIGGMGIAAPSANKYESVSPTTAYSVLEELESKLDKKKDFVIDGGSSDIGIESTIISCLNTKPKILRNGAISINDVKRKLQIEIDSHEPNSKVKFSGGLLRHYSPRAQIIINGKAENGDGFLALASISTPEGCVRLSHPKNAIEFARVLYAVFREADHLGLQRIVVIPPKGDEIEVAIRERLEKAAR